MTPTGIAQILIYFAIIAALAVPLGTYMARVFNGERTWLSPVFRPVEAVFYGLSGVDEKREQGWVSYAVAMLLFNLVCFLLLYAMLRIQASLPYNPQGMPNVPVDLSLNTAISFVTNTNW